MHITGHSSRRVDFKQRWITDHDWTYTADLSPFTSKRAQNSSDKTLLVFYGLDTIANIVRRDIDAYCDQILLTVLFPDFSWPSSRLGQQSISAAHFRCVCRPRFACWRRQ